jgi:hypothetical protein
LGQEETFVKASDLSLQNDMVFTESGTAFLAGSYNDTAAFFRSEDRCRTWTVSSLHIKGEAEYIAQNGTSILLLARHRNDKGESDTNYLFRSNNGGRDWKLTLKTMDYVRDISFFNSAPLVMLDRDSGFWNLQVLSLHPGGWDTVYRFNNEHYLNGILNDTTIYAFSHVDTYWDNLTGIRMINIKTGTEKLLAFDHVLFCPVSKGTRYRNQLQLPVYDSSKAQGMILRLSTDKYDLIPLTGYPSLGFDLVMADGNRLVTPVYVESQKKYALLISSNEGHSWQMREMDLPLHLASPALFRDTLYAMDTDSFRLIPIRN